MSDATAPKNADVADRLTQRLRVLKACTIAYSGRHVTQIAAVRDISEDGARLRVENSASIPDTFELLLDLDGIEADCEVVWRKLKEVGVRFTATRVVPPKRLQVIGERSRPGATAVRRPAR